MIVPSPTAALLKTEAANSLIEDKITIAWNKEYSRASLILLI
jgi:hypothetical protein